MEFEQEAARLHSLRAGAVVAKSNLITTAASAVFFFVICTGSILAGTGLRWVGPDNQLLPFETAEEAEEFLKKARVVSRKRVGAGINNPIKVLLEQDGIQAHAVFRDVRVSKPTARFSGKIVLNFRGDALFEISAYLNLNVGGASGPRPPGMERSPNREGMGASRSPVAHAPGFVAGRRPKAPPTFPVWNVEHGTWNERRRPTAPGSRIGAASLPGRQRPKKAAG